MGVRQLLVVLVLVSTTLCIQAPAYCKWDGQDGKNVEQGTFDLPWSAVGYYMMLRGGDDESSFREFFDANHISSVTLPTGEMLRPNDINIEHFVDYEQITDSERYADVLDDLIPGRNHTFHFSYEDWWIGFDMVWIQSDLALLDEEFQSIARVLYFNGTQRLSSGTFHQSLEPQDKIDIARNEDKLRNYFDSVLYPGAFEETSTWINCKLSDYSLYSGVISRSSRLSMVPVPASFLNIPLDLDMRNPGDHKAMIWELNQDAMPVQLWVFFCQQPLIIDCF